MPLRPQMLADLAAALGPAVIPALNQADPAHDIYEAYVLGLVLNAATAEGATVSFENVTGPNAGIATFRSSPGHIWWQAQPYTHALLAFPGKPSLEVHLGIYVSGVSGVLHEVDVAVLRRDEGLTCRMSQVPPRSSKMVLGIECKFYSKGLKLHLARGFMGLCRDLPGRDLFFVTNIWAESVERLLVHHDAWNADEITPVSLDKVDHLRHLFIEVFHKYKVKN